MTRNDGRNSGYNGDEAGNTAIYQYTVLTVFENPGKSFDFGEKMFPGLKIPYKNVKTKRNKTDPQNRANWRKEMAVIKDFCANTVLAVTHCVSCCFVWDLK